MSGDTAATVLDASAVSDVTVVPETVAEAFLMQLQSRGITNFFVNAGTDFAPIVEAYARLDATIGSLLPTPIIAGHENVAMGMAHGAYLMTGEAQAVMFHVNVGTANALCGALNAAAERVPLLICAGRSPIFEGGTLGARNTRVAWGQEMYDQASIVREAVKWEYELRGAEQLEGVLDRALTIAATEPKGPVYLTLPREVIAAPAGSLGAKPAVARPTVAHPDPAAIDVLADRLADAQMPVISAMASGAEPDSVWVLADLCERFAIGYAEEQARYLNCPSDHPLHFGYGLSALFKDIDVLCFVEADVPWVTQFGEPRPDAFVAQCGTDPNFSRYPVRTHRSDLAITSGSKALFEALIVALEARRERIDRGRYGRLADLATAARGQRQQASQAELERDGPITPAFLSATLGKLIHEDCVVFNEYWLSRPEVHLNRAASYFYLPATGGLGWALPAAMGARASAPHRTAIVAIGDGTYMFSNPAACHHASQKHDLPVLTVICNNSRWGAVDGTARLVYPTGHMTKKPWLELSDLRPSPAYEEYCQASGGYGVKVTERSQLADALSKAMRVVEVEKRQAVVNVIC